MRWTVRFQGLRGSNVATEQRIWWWVMRLYAFGSRLGPSPFPLALAERSTPGRQEAHTLACLSRGDSEGVEGLKRRHGMIGDREGDLVAEREELGGKGAGAKEVTGLSVVAEATWTTKRG